MSLNIHNRFSKGVRNKGDASINQTWWQTSFNMPVKNIFYDNGGGAGSAYTNTEGFLTGYGSGTSFDLTGFQAGWEAILGDTVFEVTGPESAGTINMTQTWKNPSGTVLFTNGPFSYSYPGLGSGIWVFYQIASNQGVAAWEISGNGTYSMTANVTGSIVQTLTSNFTITNCPSVTAVTPGALWIEGTDLRFTSANGHIHTVYGNNLGFVGTSYAGNIWIDTADNLVRWIATNGYKYVGKYNFKQFSSYFSGGPSPGVVSGQTPGFLWVDNNFGYEHIGYIANDGYKWIFPSGADPYANPPASSSP